MQSEAAQEYSFEVIGAGPDWLTATAPRSREGRPFRDACEAVLDDERAACGDVKQATLRDYTGRRGDGFFIGERKQDRLCVLSGRRCLALFDKIAPTARNVSRLDLQVTVWTHGEQPNLAREGYEHLRALPPQRGRPRNLTLIQSHPNGETLNVNRRSSDAYARLYDWSAAHKAGVPQTVWRYEVEFKRAFAAHQASALLAASHQATHASNLVHAWFKVRGLQPTWLKGDTRLSSDLAPSEPVRDALAWFYSSVSKTVAREINRHGLDAVLLALGLSDKVRPIGRRSRAYATKPTRPI